MTIGQTIHNAFTGLFAGNSFALPLAGLRNTLRTECPTGVFIETAWVDDTVLIIGFIHPRNQSNYAPVPVAALQNPELERMLASMLSEIEGYAGNRTNQEFEMPNFMLFTDNEGNSDFAVNVGIRQRNLN